MGLTHLLLIVIIAAFYINFSTAARISFEKCAWKGFECQNAKEIPNKLDITFHCNTTLTGQVNKIYINYFNLESNLNCS